MIAVISFLVFVHNYISWCSDGLQAGQWVPDSQQGQDFSLFHNMQTDSGAHPASYLMGTEDSLPEE
jgi:hypothetical protein